VSKKATAPPTAYSYLRFSSPEQAKGDSIRRQEELRDAWLARTGAVLDTSLSLRDEGVSGFTGRHRENEDRHALAAFMELVRRGRIQRGSYLVVESLDRLSREHIRPALTLLLNLIEAGIRVVQLLPVEAVYDESVEPMQLLMAIMELSRGHSESKTKSERVGRAWARKKATDAAAGKPITKRAPAWLKVSGGRFVVDERAAGTIRRIFREAIAGNGVGAIAARLNAEGVEPVGHAGYWARSYVFKLLHNRALLGEYQPHTRRHGKKRAPEGPAIADYFPRIISDGDFYAAAAAAAGRKKKGGRPAARVHLWTGLLKDARDGGGITRADKHGADKRKGAGPVLMSYKGWNGVGGSSSASFPADPFERAILHKLREIDPREILPDEENGAAAKVLTLTGQAADIEGRIAAIQAQLVEGGEVAAAVGALRTLEGRRDRVLTELAEARREASSPLSAAWGEAQGMLATLDAAEDQHDARTRLRAVLRRVIEVAYCLFTPSGVNRLAAVQLRLAGGGVRDYLVYYRRGHGNKSGTLRESETRVGSLSGPEGFGGFDLRRRADVRAVEKFLASLDPDALARMELVP
jgi:DNA invertase Pin-like site-specific DNA recombinase